MPEPKRPETSGAPVPTPIESTTCLSTFGVRKGAERPRRQKLPPEHRPLPRAREVDLSRVLNPGERPRNP